MASAAEALAAQLGLAGVGELSQLLSPEELQASLLLMQEQLGSGHAPVAAAAAPGSAQAAAQQQLEYAAAWAAEAGGEAWEAESGRASAGSESSASASAGAGAGAGAGGTTGGAVFLPGGPRVLDRTGAWVCTCGRRNRGGAGGGSRVAGKLCTNPKCSQRICRKWLTGPCGADCPFLHPPFDAAAEWAPAPGAKAALWQGAPRWKPPAAAAAAAAKVQPAPPPAVNPWLRKQQQQQEQQQAAAAAAQAAQAAQAAAQPAQPAPQPSPMPTAWQAAAALQQQAQQAAAQQQQQAAAAPAAVSRGWDPFSSFGFAPMAATAAVAAAPQPEPRREGHLPLAAVAMLARPASAPLVQPAASGAGDAQGIGRVEGAGVDDLLQHLGIAPWEAAAAAPTSPPASAAPLGAFAAAPAAAPAPGSSALAGAGGLLGGSAFSPAPGGGLGLGLDVTGGPLNGSSEYTGCLGAVAQCLWRCADFRAQVMAWGPEVCGREPALGALNRLFLALAVEEQRRQAVGPPPGAPMPRRGLADAAELRRALAALPGLQRFRADQEPGDALLALYERLMGVAAEGVQAAFGLPFSDHVRCHVCGTVSRQSAYVQYFHNTQVDALRAVRSFSPGLGMGNLLKLVEAQELALTCDEAVGGCGVRNSVVHALAGLPAVFTLQLRWPSRHEAADAVAGALAALDDKVDLADFYSGVPRGRVVYRLHSLVCYFGAHHCAFVWAADLGAWLMYDDASVARVGSWADVRAKCQAGRIQPSLLFYEAAAA